MLRWLRSRAERLQPRYLMGKILKGFRAKLGRCSVCVSDPAGNPAEINKRKIEFFILNFDLFLLLNASFSVFANCFFEIWGLSDTLFAHYTKRVIEQGKHSGKTSSSSFTPSAFYQHWNNNVGVNYFNILLYLIRPTFLGIVFL